MMDGFGIMQLQQRLSTAVHVPKRQDFKCFGCNAVINEIPNAAYQQTANIFGPASLVGNANTWLLSQQSQGFTNIGTNGTWRCWSIFGPPFSGLMDMRGSARGYLNV